MSARGADVAVATITLARDPGEEKLLRVALTTLAAHQRPVFVCDGGSGDGFVEFLRELPGVHLVALADRGLVGQVRASLKAAANVTEGFVLYTESDKVDFFQRHLRGFLSAAEALNAAGCVLASRSAAAFSTFPATQQYAEAAINGLCSHFLHVAGDYSYGPFLLKPELATHVDRVAADAGWGWRHFIFAVAQRLGYRLVHVADAYACPEDQRRDNDPERLHRLRQLGQNVNGLLAGLTVDLGVGRSAGSPPS